MNHCTKLFDSSVYDFFLQAAGKLGISELNLAE